MEHVHNTFAAYCEKSKMAFFTSLVMKNINLLFMPLRFPVKLIYCIDFGSTGSAFCLLNSIAIIL